MSTRRNPPAGVRRTPRGGGSGAFAAAVRGERPLTARSVLASALLGTDPPVLDAARLVRVAALFGITDNSARVALSRMTAAGEAVATGGEYRLAGHLLARQARQAASREPSLRPWSGDWLVLVVTAPRRDAAERVSARRALLAARMAERRDGVWLRPDNLAVDVTGLGDTFEQWSGRPAGDPVALAVALWPLDGWAGRARDLEARMALLAPALASGDAAALAPGFVVSAAVLRHFQADPLLPPELVSPDWPGPGLRATYAQWDRSYRAVLAHWHRAGSA